MLLVALGLAMDAFAVAIATGLVVVPLTGRHVFRLSFHFGLFQFLMPVIGWAAGATLASRVGRFDHWIAFVLLGFIGGKMLWESFRGEHEERQGDPTRGLSLVMFSIATSLDALAVGVSLGCARVSIWLPSVIIGLVAGAMTMVGIRFGARLGKAVGRWAERGGGLVLIGIGAKMLVSHVWG